MCSVPSPPRCQLCAPSPAHPECARIWHIILSLPGNVPNKQGPPQVAKSPGDTDHAQMQKFIVRQNMGTSQAAPHSPHSHTTNLVLAREPLFVAVSA